MAKPRSGFASLLNDGQRASLVAIAERIGSNGVILADEVGMGKTRIAAALTNAVLQAKGRVAILVPPGLGFQWGDELRKMNILDVPLVLRSLDAYLDAWAEDDKEHRPWAEYPALLVSHAFCNWRIRNGNGKNWKWTLLPQTLAIVQSRLRESGRMPRGTKANVKFDDKRVASAATWIAENARKGPLKSLATTDVFSSWGSKSELLKPENYLKHTEFRKGLESVVGLGLGEFDLLVIDEAHKSRGAESNLNRLLEHVVATSGASRRLALTATPIELDVSQWESTLKRLDTTEEQRAPIVQATEDYAKAISRLRLGWRANAEVRTTYASAARQFETALSPYLLRRDKREDEDVLAFAKASGKADYDYRNLQEVPVKFEDLRPAWRQAICAAEALSVVREPVLKGRTKRLRLTIGNGHGIASVIDEAFRDDTEDKKQIEEDRAQADGEEDASELDSAADQPVANNRSKWWVSILKDAFAHDPDILFDHPAILAAVITIEDEVKRGEKVLVFGRFTRPMRALVNLLNARQMLRTVQNEQFWPQSKVHADEWPAVRMAHRQLKCTVDLNKLDACLSTRYRQARDQRAQQRKLLLGRLRAGLAEAEKDAKKVAKEDAKNVTKEIARCCAILDAINKGRKAPLSGEVEDDERDVPLLARAIEANTDRSDASDADLAKAFRALVKAAGDNDSAEADVDNKLAEETWNSLEEYLREGYTSQRGGFARLMFGETKPQTRRIIQLAFNRPNSFPRVLVAQSLVGREGLNLHESCRIVVLLHPEWNPGVVEQQIGRVDRVNSRWAKMLRQTIGEGVSGADLPRIEIRPIIFKGTYDEHNWEVLRERWEDLRAQLHGEAIPARLRAGEDAEGRAILDEIASARPNFSPQKKDGGSTQQGCPVVVGLPSKSAGCD